MKKQKKIHTIKKEKQWGNHILESPAHQKNRDNIKLLISYPEFQKVIKKTRLYLGIPESGFEHGNGQAIKKWNNEITEKSDEMFMAPELYKELRKIRKKTNRKEISHKQAKMQSNLLHNKMPINYLTNTIKNIIRKLDLPHNYDHFLRGYIISNTIRIPTRNFAVVVHNPTTDWKNLGYLTVEIYTRLDDNDLKEIKEAADNWVGKKLPKYQSLTDIDKKIAIEQWHDNKNKYDEVTGEYYKTNNSEIAKDLLHGKKHSKKVYDISRTNKRLRKSRFGKE